MGCYGIGVNRIVAAAVEAGHDDNGIVWPLPLAPYHVLIAPLQLNNAAVMEAAEALEPKLEAAGFDVLVDDRDQRPGRQVQGRRPDRHPAPGRDQRARPEGRDDRGQVADRRRRAQRLGRDGRRGDPGRAGDRPGKAMETVAAERRISRAAARGQ